MSHFSLDKAENESSDVERLLIAAFDGLVMMKSVANKENIKGKERQLVLTQLFLGR